MSTTDKPVSFYQYTDTTDPTPYETDARICPDEQCMLCGREFYKGETVMSMVHSYLDHDLFYFHKKCLMSRFDDPGAVLDALDKFGFEVEEVEEEV